MSAVLLCPMSSFKNSFSLNFSQNWKKFFGHNIGYRSTTKPWEYIRIGGNKNSILIVAPNSLRCPQLPPDVNRFYWTILEKENPEIFSESGSYGFYRTVPDALVVAMQGLEPRTPRIWAVRSNQLSYIATIKRGQLCSISLYMSTGK